ncbi:hypothetical protein GCM10017786_69940 [Amycolatopsis deserti]|uniref:MarR family transcriptional regulator n=1 Tax=Amycolatopsis deserti TaxID=185696 RepID=A0ABQ3JE71_9PSEU|nr:hypothetical protein [Amycolatopsis deserti]GHF25764.1 hypothetical protein GCM10017786_69940 [Amycolatopsis deserti]
MDPLDRPIGFWLKHLHNLLEDGLTGVLADRGLTRRHWQALNTSRHGAEALAVFDGADEARADLVTRGWITTDGTLTDDGRTARAEIAERVRRFRELSLTGLTDDQYADTVRTLATMARNLETAR